MLKNLKILKPKLGKGIGNFCLLASDTQLFCLNCTLQNEKLLRPNEEYIFTEADEKMAKKKKIKIKAKGSAKKKLGLKKKKLLAKKVKPTKKVKAVKKTKLVVAPRPQNNALVKRLLIFVLMLNFFSVAIGADPVATASADLFCGRGTASASEKNAFSCVSGDFDHDGNSQSSDCSDPCHVGGCHFGHCPFPILTEMVYLYTSTNQVGFQTIDRIPEDPFIKGLRRPPRA